MHRLALSFSICVVLFALPVGGAVITSLPSSAYIQMPSINYFGSGPQSFNGVQWSSTNGSAVYGYTSGYGFGGNGSWDGGLGPMAGVNSSSDSMTFYYAAPVQYVGGFINYATPGYGTASMAIYDSGMNLLESYLITFLTGGGVNTGQTLGFDAGAPIISYFVLTGAYIGIAGTSPEGVIPEPASALLLAGGIGVIALLRRRRRVR